MAVICARCGTQNPDGNQFCQACGTPLAMAPAVTPAQPGPGSNPFPPPPAMGPPPAGSMAGPPPTPAPNYQSPYYKQNAVGPQPPVHRTPWMLIIAVIVGLVVLMAGCGTAIALLANRANHVTTGGILPSPSPAGSPQPSGSPTASPTPTSTGGTTVSNSGESFVMPSGWTVASKDEQSITITNPSGDGSVTIGSGASSPVQSAQQNKSTVDRLLQGKYPDTKDCPGTQTTTGTINGASGIFWVLCFTLASGGQSIQAGAPLFAGANTSGGVYYLIMLLTSQDNLDNFITQAAPILSSIDWKLK